MDSQQMPLLWGEKNSLIIKADIDKTEKLVLLILFSYADNKTDDCFPSVPTIAHWAGVCDKTVQNCINSLIFRKIVRKQPRKKGNGATSNLYWIDFEQIPQRTKKKGRGGQIDRGGGVTVTPGGGVTVTPPPGVTVTPITDPDINSPIKNSPDRTYAHDPIDEDTTNKTGEMNPEKVSPALKPLEDLLNLENGHTHANSSKDTSQALLDGNQSINTYPLVNNSIPNKKKDLPAARTTKVAKPSPRGEQVARAKKDSLCQRGIENDRWDDLEDFKKFRAYVTQQARDRAMGITVGAEGTVHDENWIEGVIVNTANCTDDNSPVLGIWRCWQQEIPAPPLVVGTEEIEVPSVPADEIARAKAFLARKK